MKKFACALSVLISSLLYSQSDNPDPVRFVDPLIGTAEHGHTYPGATVPFGMVQLSPDNGRTDLWDWCSEYNYSDSLIAGFSHTHLSGTGIGDLYDISFLPMLNDSLPSRDYRARFSHADEYASAGFYSVTLDPSKILVELTASERVGFHRYTFPASERSSLLIDLARAFNFDNTVRSSIRVVDDTTITGFRFSSGWARNQKIYFVARFSVPIVRWSLENDSRVLPDVKEVTGTGTRALVQFSSSTLIIKVGISAVDIEGAQKNLDEEGKGWDFDGWKNEAEAQWRKALSVVHVTPNDDSTATIFYTALYHSMLTPTIFSDVDGRYFGADGGVHQSKGFVNYTTFSFWDTFRALHPLITLIQPQRVNDFVNSILAFKRESGLMPIWPLVGNETSCMVGFHSIPVVAEAYRKGFRGFPAEEALEAMKATMMSDAYSLDLYKRYGYIPADLAKESVGMTLEDAYDDWSVARMAQEMGDTAAAGKFAHRAEAFRYVFDSDSKFMRGKLSDGSWRVPFNPRASAHRNDDYVEGTAWQYTWLVQHDPHGLICLFGGKENFGAKLDSLFNQESTIEGENASPDISGLIGQYAHGNEPDHHIPYLYAYAGMPWKTQQRVTQIVRTMYKKGKSGSCGNDDCGQMSAWYVLSALGFYPVSPVDGIYVLGSPIIKSATIQIAGNKKFTITVNNLSENNYYIQSVHLNSRLLDRSYITHEEITRGGEIVFEMGNEPNKILWSSESETPPSMSIMKGEAGFTSDKRTIMAGESVSFKSRSSRAKSWTWSFPGGTPATSNDENPMVRYDSIGPHAVVLTVSDGVDKDNICRPEYIDVVKIDREAIASQIRQDFLMCWNAYKKYAMGHDELNPIARTSNDWYNESFLMTPVDALDTMILMGLKEEADATRDYIVKHLSFNKDIYVSNFEFTIRFLGGLLSSYQNDRRREVARSCKRPRRSGACGLQNSDGDAVWRYQP